jgi:Flp pilus assembly protein CpaB
MAMRLGHLALPAVDRRALLGVGLAALAATLVLVVTRPSPTFPVLIAGSDLPAGVPLSEVDLAVRRVADPTGLIQGTEPGELADWRLKVPLVAGEPVLASVLQPPQLLAAPNLIALDIEAAHAVLGRLAGGDLVDVYVTSGSSAGNGTTRLVASEVYVVQAALVDVGGGRDRVELLVAVDDRLASELAAAARSGELDLVRVGP